MFILDGILLAPAKGFLWIVRELHNAAQQEIKGESERLAHRLSTLYMMLETGQITPEAFDAEEAAILARLDELDGSSDASHDPDQLATTDDDHDDNEEDDGDDEDDNEQEDVEVDDTTDSTIDAQTDTDLPPSFQAKEP